MLSRIARIISLPLVYDMCQRDVVLCIICLLITDAVLSNEVVQQRSIIVRTAGPHQLIT